MPLNLSLSREINELDKGQVVEQISADVWEQLRPQTRKIDDNVVIQLLFPEGKAPIRTKGPLYLLKTTYLKIELDGDGKIKEEQRLNKVIGSDIKIDHSEGIKEELMDSKANYKVDTYVQHQSGSNKLVVYEMLLPLWQDITRYCSRLNRSKIREGNFPPVLTVLLFYSVFINVVLLGPQIGFYIDIFDTIPFAFNVFCWTSIGWLVYVEYIQQGFWMTAKIVDRHQDMILFQIKQGIGDRFDQKLVSVRRPFDVYYIKVHFSHTAMLEAMEHDLEQLQTELVTQWKQRYAKAVFEQSLEQEKNKSLEEKVKLLAQAVDNQKNDYRRVAYEYLLKGYKLKTGNFFEPERGFDLQNIFNERLLKTVLALAAGLIALFVLVYFGLPVVYDMVDMVLVHDFPEVSGSLKILIGLGLVTTIVIAVAVVIVKAWKST